MPFLLPQIPQRLQRSVFFGSAGPGVAYEVPEEASALYMICVGGAGGGGAGFSAAAAAARGGGGGGGTGGVTRAIIPVIELPRVLYVAPGLGGVPSAGGGQSFVSSVNAQSNASNIIFAQGGGAGGTGTGAAVGAAGSAGAAAALNSNLASWLAVHEYSAGIAGGAGGAVAGGAGTNITWGTLGISPGSGGGGTTSADFAGGAQTGAGLVPTIAGGAAGSNDGNSGYWHPDYLFGTGGSGGGSSNTGVGGRGGNGAFGCGGGGGGGGTTGGTGGNGGHGFVIIQPL